MKAIVLKRVRYGESDLILHFLLESNTVLKGFAPGARQSNRRYPHRFDLSGIYNIDQPSTAPGERLIRLGDVELVEFAPEFRADVVLMARWAMILEWISQDLEQSLTFDHLIQLRADLRCQNLESFHDFFWQIVVEEGIAPSIDQCAICHQSDVLDEGAFGAQGFMHSRCGSGISLQAETLNWILRRLDLKERPAVFGPAILKELDVITVPYLQQQLGRSLKSFEFFQQLGLERNPVPEEQSPAFALQK